MMNDERIISALLNGEGLEKSDIDSAFELEWQQMDTSERHFWQLMFLKQDNPERFKSTIEFIENGIDKEDEEIRKLLAKIKQTKTSEAKLALAFGLRIMVPDRYLEILNTLKQKQKEADDKA